MSEKERHRLRVISELKEGRLKQEEAAVLLKVEVRQVRRSLRRFEAEGDRGLVHGLRGRPSNRKLAPEIEAKALERFRESYRDFGPTLAVECLASCGTAPVMQVDDTYHEQLDEAEVDRVLEELR